jgi:hypothetical protein
MAGGVGERAFLAPAGHAAVNEPRIARQHDVWAESETLHDAGPKPFDQRIGVREQFEHLRDRGLVLQVKLDDLAATDGNCLQILSRTDAIERYDLSAHICQHHARERAGADAGKFDDAEAGEWTGGAIGGLGGWFIKHVVFPSMTNLGGGWRLGAMTVGVAERHLGGVGP